MSDRRCFASIDCTLLILQQAANRRSWIILDAALFEHGLTYTADHIQFVLPSVLCATSPIIINHEPSFGVNVIEGQDASETLTLFYLCLIY
jgi:hypothetical protein